MEIKRAITSRIDTWHLGHLGRKTMNRAEIWRRTEKVRGKKLAGSSHSLGLHWSGVEV